MRKFRHDISIIPPKDVRFSGKSLSEYELILALIEKVNELIKYTNSVAELVYALEKWINDEFINAIDESTKKTLIEWRESGYLQELVEDYLVNLTVATSELLDEDEQKFEKSWHPIFDTKMEVEEVEMYGKTYNKYTFKKGVSNDIFTITRVSITERQTHDSYVELFNLGKGFKIKDAISGKYVNVEDYEVLDPEIDALPIKKYKLRNVYANLTFELDEDVEQIEVILFNSSIRSKVNIDEGFIWLVSRMDKLEDDMVIFEQWVREFVTTKITELENKVNKQIDDTIEYVDEELDKKADLTEFNQFKDVTEKIINPIDLTKGGLEIKKIISRVLERNRSGHDYSNTQGMTYTKDNKVLVAFIPIYNQETTNTGYFEEFNLLDGSSVRRVVNTQMYHGNSLSFYNDKVYMAPMHNNKIFVYNYNTLSKETELTLPKPVSGVHVDGEYIYTTGSGNNVIEVYNMGGTYIRTINLEISNLNLAEINQSFTIKDGLIYTIKYKPNVIYVHNLDGKLIKMFNYPLSTPTSSIGEVEDISFYGSNLLINSQIGLQYDYWNFNLSLLNLETGILGDSIVFEEDDTSKIIYVDNSVNVGNPDGSSSRPFSNIAEALMAGRNIDVRLGSSFRIYVNATSTPYDSFRISRLQNVSIQGRNGKPIIKKVQNYYSKVEYRDIIFDGENNGYTLDMDNSDIFTRDCEVKNIGTGIRVTNGSSLTWVGGWTGVGNGQVLLTNGGKLFNTSTSNYRMARPTGATWFTQKPITIWSGSDDSGTFDYPKSVFGTLYFYTNQGNIVEVQNTNGNVELRFINHGNSSDEAIIAEYIVNLTNEGFNVTSKRALRLTPEGVSVVGSPNFKIVQIKGH